MFIITVGRCTRACEYRRTVWARSLYAKRPRRNRIMKRNIAGFPCFCLPPFHQFFVIVLCFHLRNSNCFRVPATTVLALTGHENWQMFRTSSSTSYLFFFHRHRRIFTSPNNTTLQLILHLSLTTFIHLILIIRRYFPI